MLDDERKPGIDILRGKSIWSDSDKSWYKITITLMLCVFFVVMAFALKEWLLPALAGSKLMGLKFGDLFKILKGRSP